MVRDLPVGARPNHVEPHAIVSQLTGPDWTGEPHAIARTPEGDLCVGPERGNRVTVLATGDPDDPQDDHVVTTITDARMRRLIDIAVKP